MEDKFEYESGDNSEYESGVSCLEEMEGKMTLVPRAAWDAASSKELLPLKVPVDNVWFVYDTGTKVCRTKEECIHEVLWLQRDCMERRKMADIAYNFLIGGDGRVYEGRGWSKQAPKSRTFPETDGKRIDIGYLGNLKRKKLTFNMLKGGLQVVSYGLREGMISLSFLSKEWESPGVVFKENFDLGNLKN